VSQARARDPLDARIAIALMQSLAAGGDRVGAIQHARVHEILIAEELSLPADRDVVRSPSCDASTSMPSSSGNGRGTRDRARTGDGGLGTCRRPVSHAPPEPVAEPRIAAPPAQTSDVAVWPAHPAEWRIRRPTALLAAALLAAAAVLGAASVGTMAPCLTHPRHRSPPTSNGLREVARSAM
jgi:hypothetical protein